MARTIRDGPGNFLNVTASADHLGFSIKIRVYYEDTDFGGIVYYANYLKFMERARTEYLRSLGFDQSELLARQRRQFVVRSAAVEFVSPARFDDVLLVDAEVSNVRRASLEFTQRCTIAGPDVSPSSGRLVASGKLLIACLDADSHKPRAIPEELKMSLHR